MTVQLSIPVVVWMEQLGTVNQEYVATLWLQTCDDEEMEYLHDIIKGGEITEGIRKTSPMV